VKLTVTGPDGSDAITKSDYINVVEPALANFSGSPTSGLAPLFVDYVNLSGGNFSTCHWDFGDGEGSNICPEPSHIYQIPGLYTVALSIDGTGGPSVESKMAYISVNHPPPQAAFMATPRTGQTPLEVSFTSIVTGSVEQYRWHFGDGDQAQSANPSHTYHLAGIFSVTLLITGPGGADQAHYPNYIVVDPSPNAPQAEFSADLISGTVPLTVTFTAVITGTVESWEWDFGDGQDAIIGPVIQHTYLTPGLYDVSLTVANSHGGVITTRSNYITAIKDEPGSHYIYLPLVLNG
jgi:PKD repeat protein